MSVEAVGVLMDVGLQAGKRVNASQPSFEHDRFLELGKVLLLLFRLLPDQVRKFAFRALIAAPPISPHRCIENYKAIWIQHEPFQVLSGSDLHQMPVDAETSFPFRSTATTMICFHPSLRPTAFSS